MKRLLVLVLLFLCVAGPAQARSLSIEDGHRAIRDWEQSRYSAYTHVERCWQPIGLLPMARRTVVCSFAQPFEVELDTGEVVTTTWWGEDEAQLRHGKIRIRSLGGSFPTD